MSSMELGHFLAIAIFVSYFVLIISLFYLVLASVKNQDKNHANRLSKTTLTFGVLSCVSFFHTWYHMLMFLSWSFSAYEANLRKPESEATVLGPLLFRVSSWLLDTSLFEQAWAAVSFGKPNWWWSQQLCLYTVGAWTTYLTTQGHIHRIRHVWAYMLLGQLVAISVASNLFFISVHLSLSSPSSRKPPQKHGSDHNSDRISPILYLPVLISLATVANSPFTSVANGTFLPNLLLMHTLIIIPLFCPQLPLAWLPNMRLRTLTLSLSSVSLLLHIRATLLVFPSLNLNILKLNDWGVFAAAVWNVLNTYHPAQSSIGWDVVWTTVSFLVWAMIYGDRVGRRGSSGSELRAGVGVGAGARLLLLSSTPVVSAGAVAPLVFGFSDKEKIERVD